MKPFLFAVSTIFFMFADTANAQDLLSNVSFEDEEDGKALGWIVIGSETSGSDDENVKLGDHCLSLISEEEKGYPSVAAYQTVAIDPADKTAIRLTGWIEVSRSEKSDAFGYLELSFVPRPEFGQVAFKSYKTMNVAANTEGWQFVSMDIPVPKSAGSVMARCVVRGVGEVRFDDLQLTKIEADDLTPLRVVEVDSRFIVRAKDDLDESPWISVSVPLLLESQTPLAVKVETDPEDVVSQIGFLEDRENQPLKITLKKIPKGTTVRLRVKTLVGLRNRVVSDGKGVELPTKRSLDAHPMTKDYLKTAPGIEVESKHVREVASTLDRTDFASLVNDLNQYLKENMTYAADSSQGAEDCLESKKAVCTGYANVAAALLRANEVPTRVLACLVPDGRLQEHYIVEAWTEELGWARIESTSAIFPWEDLENVILRVVYPDAPRTDYFAPLYWKLGGGLVGGRGGGVFDISRESDWSCQFTKRIADFGVDSKFGSVLNSQPKKIINQLTEKSIAGNYVELLSSDELDLDVEYQKKLYGLLNSWKPNR